MGFIPDSINRLIEQFAKFPGIGRKTARRMAFHLLNASDETAVQLAQAILDMKTKIRFCDICGGITEEETCEICLDSKRNRNLICVVEEAADIYAFERTNSFYGLYHVLGGVLSPLDGIGPDDLNIDSLLPRINHDSEIIVATNPSVEGETTALYLAKLLNSRGVIVTRLARGLPVGSDLEYTDDATLIRAIEGRTSL
ncbi:MAG: recombination protein RecR [Candidatus Marinimicrobia bacterium]|nr:recombination protein RecR [Candidatus Neomarinimicrobiota bacterium]